MVKQLEIFSKEEQLECGIFVIKDIRDIYEVDFLCDEEIALILDYEKELSLGLLCKYEKCDNEFIYFYQQDQEVERSYHNEKYTEKVSSRGLWRDAEYVLSRRYKEVSTPTGDFTLSMFQLGGERLRFQDLLHEYGGVNKWKFSTKPKQVLNSETQQLEVKNYIDKIWIRKKVRS